MTEREWWFVTGQPEEEEKKEPDFSGRKGGMRWNNGMKSTD